MHAHTPQLYTYTYIHIYCEALGNGKKGKLNNIHDKKKVLAKLLPAQVCFSIKWHYYMYIHMEEK